MASDKFSRIRDQRREGELPPLVLEVKGNSLDDGPGIRSVVFFKGCPLSCCWCHNPESKSREAEISHDRELCLDCGACIEACPEKAIDRNFLDRQACTLCGECLDVCPSGALSMVGKIMTPEEIAREVEKDLPFFQTSGGGVTLSGGEPTLFMDFAGRLASMLKEKGIHVLLETCGLFPFRVFMDRLFYSLDTIYYDIKIMDPEAHRRECGADNKRILENFSLLVSKCRAAGKELLARVPLVPGITDREENLEAVAGFLGEQGVDRVALMEYNPLWGIKCEKIGAENRLADRPESREWMEREKVKACQELFQSKGIEVV